MAEALTGGRMVAVVGPSGAGKDTLIDLARASLGGEPAFVFPRRLITRPPATGEDHEPISRNAFDGGERDGAFALSWRAHGLGYAIPASAARDIAESRIVVCNLSRGVVADARSRFAAVVALVSAPADVLEARIAARGREGTAAARARLDRPAPADEAALAADLVIENDGAPQAGGDRLIGFLRALAASRGAA